MIELKDNKKVNARDLHEALGITQDFSNWIKYNIERGDFVEGVDFTTILAKSTGGRPRKEYDLEKDTAIAFCSMSTGKKANEIRRHLINIFNQRTDLQLLNAKEIAFAYNVIDCLKYLDNQKNAYEMHKNAYVNSYDGKSNAYAVFNMYRNNIIGWNKDKVDEELRNYLGNRRPKNVSMSEKLSIIDSAEAIRVACLDMLFTKGESVKQAMDFSKMVKDIVSEMKHTEKGFEILRHNETNLFQVKENADIKQLM